MSFRHLIFAAAVCAAPALAQHTGHSHPEHAAPTDGDPHAGHAGHASHSAHGARSALSPAPMSVDGSGTSWLPAASPMEAAHGAAGGWAWMLHGAAFPRVTAQDALGAGSRGDVAVGAPNWVMAMAQRPLGAARLTLRGMVSLDAVTEGGAGYPLLFQSGETFEGERLVDRQHPHDGLAELSATLAADLSDDASAFAYAAYPGEPALGPTAFMHRPSARFGADAPLSHHWQDATHVAWGVATAGVVVGGLKLDASVFTGAEPDEARWTPDRPRFDSFAARLTWSPSPRWTAQVSRGRLAEPEAAEPGVDVDRTTASVLFAAPLPTGDLSATLAWGLNAHRDAPVTHADARDEDPDGHADDGHHAHGGGQHALLAEAALRLGPWAGYTRAEWTEKSGEELGLAVEGVPAVGAWSVGGARRVGAVAGLEAMLGVQATAYAVPAALRGAYGARPVSAQVFLRITP